MRQLGHGETVSEKVHYPNQVDRSPLAQGGGLAENLQYHGASD
jgi:hypothetical protein